MLEKKFNWKIYFFILLFSGIILMAFYTTFLLATNQVVDEDGLPLPPALIGFMCFMIYLVCSTYAVTVIALLKQVIARKNIAFRVDESGIHNTVVFVNLFAFVIVSNVKFIPWSAVRYIDRDGDGVYIRVNKKQVSASLMGKLIIGLLGYSFCRSFTAGNLSEWEKDMISSYCADKSVCDSPSDIF